MKQFKLYFILILIFINIIPFTLGKVDYIWSANCNTHSMHPYFCEEGRTAPQKMAVNTITSEDEIKVGDVYWYRPNYNYYKIPAYHYVIHRLVKIEDGLYYFKGDNNDYVDEGIERKYIHLRVVRIL
jgi:signal peptidase I